MRTSWSLTRSGRSATPRRCGSCACPACLAGSLSDCQTCAAEPSGRARLMARGGPCRRRLSHRRCETRPLRDRHAPRAGLGSRFCGSQSRSADGSSPPRQVICGCSRARHLSAPARGGRTRRRSGSAPACASGSSGWSGTDCSSPGPFLRSGRALTCASACRPS